MRSHSYPITPQEVYKHAAAVVQPHLKFRDCGPKCTAGVLPPSRSVSLVEIGKDNESARAGTLWYTLSGVCH
jgi:hypothetical protein